MYKKQKGTKNLKFISKRFNPYIPSWKLLAINPRISNKMFGLLFCTAVAYGNL